jgi:hypothetical protein
MLHRLVTNRELSQIVSHHLRLDFHLIELLAGINTHHRPDHLRHDDHVAQVRLHQIGLLVRLGFLLGLAQFLDQAHGAALEAAVEAAAGAGVQDVEELVGGEVEESVGEGLLVFWLVGSRFCWVPKESVFEMRSERLTDRDQCLCRRTF